MRAIPRILIAGTGSGCGKTTVTCALLQALVNRNLRVRACKCGPDYIDPMFHRHIVGRSSSNLDLFLLGPDTVRRLLAKAGAGCDITVIEGVMGYYDGLALDNSAASSWQVARATHTPAALVVDARAAALSVLATVEGFLNFQPHSQIAGVILNGCSAGVYEGLAKAIRERFGSRVQPLGFLPRMEDCRLESRHLGLVTADEVEDLDRKLEVLARQAAQSLDLEGLLALGRTAPPLSFRPLPLPRFGETVRIALARDKAFCFYYADSLDLLARLGTELVPFSPLEDKELPPDIQGLYLGGGYPELYADRLSANRSMRRSIRQAVESGIPTVAECGGFMYLTQTIAGRPMAGALPGDCFDAGRLTRFGYLTLTAQSDSLLCAKGQKLPAHEFHHWDCTQLGGDWLAQKPSGRSWTSGLAGPTLYAGYPHLHFCAAPGAAVRFYTACIKEKHRHESDHPTR